MPKNRCLEKEILCITTYLYCKSFKKQEFQFELYQSQRTLNKGKSFFFFIITILFIFFLTLSKFGLLFFNFLSGKFSISKSIH